MRCRPRLRYRFHTTPSMATMDETPTGVPGGNPDFERLVGEGRRRAHELLATQRGHLNSLERKLQEQIERLTAELAHDEAETAQRVAHLDRQEEALERIKQDLDEREQEWRQAQDLANRRQRSLAAQLCKRQEDLEARERAIEAAETAGRDSRRELTVAQEELARDREELTRQRDKLAQKLTELEQEREALATAQDETKAQRRHIAKEFQARHAAHLAELDKRREEIKRLSGVQHTQLEAQLATAIQEREALAQQVEEFRKEITASDDEIDLLGKHIQAQENELSSLRQDHDRLSQELAVGGLASGVGAEEIARLRHERDALETRLLQAEAQATKSSSGDSKRDDLQRRFELAVEDVRDLKRRNAELESKLANARSGGGVAPEPANGGKLDWEAQKRKLLEALEADADEEHDEDREQERLTIEGTIRITDAVVAEKDREIAELKQMLEEQSSSLGGVAVGAAAIAGILDENELIQQERENLRQLQAEWQEKLRKAEIDLSVERAKIARDRAELDERLLALQDRNADPDPPAVPGDSKAGGSKPGRGRWLSRLGLKDEEK